MIVNADARSIPLADSSVHCVVTSPPYWGLRDYGTAGQLGLERTPEGYVAGMVAVFREVWRVLREDGVVFLNLGDSYVSSASRPGAPRGGTGGIAPRDSRAPDYAYSGLCDGCAAARSSHTAGNGQPFAGVAQQLALRDRGISPAGFAATSRAASLLGAQTSTSGESLPPPSAGCSHCGNCGACLSVLRSSSRDARLCAHRVEYIGGTGPLASVDRNQDMGALGMACLNYNLKPKDMVGIPWLVALALRADGWFLRSDIIWSKLNPMPESITDRPTKAHEYLFLLAKRERYYYDAEAIKEPSVSDHPSGNGYNRPEQLSRGGRGSAEPWQVTPHRNRRTVWEIATQPYAEAHFATFPEALVEPCIKAGTSERGACAACGAPWERVVERERVATRPGTTSKYGGLETDVRSTGPGNVAFGLATRTVSTAMTTGWQPTCACTAPTTQPLVLDPFAGSGTVGLVCHRLGRRFVGLELKKDYCDMAYRRTAQLGLV